MSTALALHIDSLRVTGDRQRCLLAVDALTLAPGTALGVRGPSGAGKSTLLMALAGLAPGLSGCIHWGAFELVSGSPAARVAFRRHALGLIFQDFLLFEELDAERNAAIAALYRPRRQRRALRQRAREQLNRLGIDHGRRRVASFSGGERQRVAVARALAHSPAVVLADEPTASLPREAADRLIDDLLAQTRGAGRTLIVASHDPALLARMDRVLTLEQGQPRDVAPASAPRVAATPL